MNKAFKCEACSARCHKLIAFKTKHQLMAHEKTLKHQTSIMEAFEEPIKSDAMVGGQPIDYLRQINFSLLKMTNLLHDACYELHLISVNL